VANEDLKQKRIQAYIAPSLSALPGKRDVIAQILREQILRGERTSGEWLRQDEIATAYGVSSTPVREALRMLEAQGLVSYEAHRGVRVADATGSYRQFFRLRTVLEELALELAMPNLTSEVLARVWRTVDAMERADRSDDVSSIERAHKQFHAELYSAANFPVLSEIIERAWSRFPWDASLRLQRKPRVLLSDHRSIVEAVEARDVDGAKHALRHHFASLEQLLASMAAKDDAAAPLLAGDTRQAKPRT
jgi:DNA-binding GntR family transcriptional regulator